MAKGQQKIKMIKTVQVGRVNYVGGNVYDVDSKTADLLLSTKTSNGAHAAIEYDGDDTPVQVRKQPLSPPGKDPKLEKDDEDGDEPFTPPDDDEEVVEVDDEEEVDEEDKETGEKKKVRRPIKRTVKRKRSR